MLQQSESSAIVGGAVEVADPLNEFLRESGSSAFTGGAVQLADP